MKKIGLAITAFLVSAQQAYAMPQPMVYGPEAIQIETTVDGTKKTAFDFLPALRLFARGIDISLVTPVASADAAINFDLARIIPIAEVSALSNENIGAKIIDHTLQSYLETSSVRNSSFGHAADAVEKNMSSNVSWGSPENTKHEVRMYMRPANAKAVMQYSGIADAKVSYAIATSELNFEISENIKAIGAEIVLSHIANPSQIRDMVNMRWNF